MGLEQWGDPGIELGDLLIELTDAVGQRGQRALVATVTGSADRVGRSPLAAAMNCGAGRPLIRL